MNGIEITVVGNLARDPELRYTQSGRPVATAGCAVSRRYKTKDSDDWQEVTSWVNLTMWGDLGEHAAGSLHKGDRVIAQGRFEQREYEVDGEKKSTWDMTVDAIGPDLRWANVTVDRITRSGGRDDAPHPADMPEPSAKAAPPQYDEEPF